MDYGDDEMKVILPNQFLPVKAIKKHKIDGRFVGEKM